jgi:hypothetical protein
MDNKQFFSFILRIIIVKQAIARFEEVVSAAQHQRITFVKLQLSKDILM